MGVVDRGCELGWISQYPHERECLFAPLTGFELEGTHVEAGVMVAEVRLSVNLYAPLFGRTQPMTSLLWSPSLTPALRSSRDHGKECIYNRAGDRQDEAVAPRLGPGLSRWLLVRRCGEERVVRSDLPGVGRESI